MTTVTNRWKSLLASVLTAGAALTMVSCGDPEPDATEEETAAAETAPADPVEIPTDTPAGETSQRIVEILNAEADTTAEDWESQLHESFTAEVSVEELVTLVNDNLRPAQPFTATNYDGGDRQAVTTLTSPVSAPIDMTVSLDADGLITGLFFGESAAAG